MKRNIKIIFCLLSLFFSIQAAAQNPLIPGYFADPSIKKFGDKYYIYSTTDGYQPFGNDGQPLVWISDNLIDWKPELLQGIPNETIWAPAVIKGKNNKYYFYCQNSVDYSGYVWVGDSPTGPFVKSGLIGGFDIEPFEDPVSKKIYVISASKEIFEMDNDVKSPTYLTKIIQKLPMKGDFFDFTEGPYLFYKDGFYYCMWAGGRCWQKSYNVRYAVSKSLTGPYVSVNQGLVLNTDLKEGVLGPGHNSILEAKGRTFVLYHRQDASREASCGYRFTSASEITFKKNGEIQFLKYIDDLGAALGYKSSLENLALNGQVFANTETDHYRAIYAVDGRNDTRWTTPINEKGSLTVNLGTEKQIKEVEIDFEYPDKWHLFKVEYSSDNQNWKDLVDHTTEAVQAYSHMFIPANIKAKYVKLTIKNAEDRTASIWELKILGER